MKIKARLKGLEFTIEKMIKEAESEKKLAIHYCADSGLKAICNNRRAAKFTTWRNSVTCRHCLARINKQITSADLIQPVKKCAACGRNHRALKFKAIKPEMIKGKMIAYKAICPIKHRAVFSTP